MNKHAIRYDNDDIARQEAKRKSKREAAKRRRDRDLGGHSTYKQTSEFEQINKQKKIKRNGTMPISNETIY